MKVCSNIDVNGVNAQPTQRMSGMIYVALYDYQSRTDGDLAFHSHELLEIIDQSHSDWWRARSKITHMEGYIPSNYVAPVKSIEAEPYAAQIFRNLFFFSR